MTFVPYQQYIGPAFAIVGLFLVAPSSYYFRMYSRVLDYAQMLYVFAIAYVIVSPTALSTDPIHFSKRLNYSFLSFMSSFMNSLISGCSTTDYACKYGNLFSPAICWLGVAIGMLIIIKLVSIKKHNAKYLPFYNFWKGLIRWFMAPLIYYSTDMLIVQNRKYGTTDRDFYASAGVLAFFALYTLIELIGLKLMQKEQEYIWKKWMQYFSHLRMGSIMAIVVISVQISSLAKYFIYGPLVIYTLLYLFKYQFTFRVFQRVIFFIGQAIMLTLFSLFIFKSDYILQYDLDLIGLAIVIVLDILLFIPKLVSYCRSHGEDADGSVAPQKSDNNDRSPKNKMKRGNSFADMEMLGQQSYQDLNHSRSNSPPSPRKQPVSPSKSPVKRR